MASAATEAVAKLSIAPKTGRGKNAALVKRICDVPEWARAVVFDAEAEILASTFSEEDVITSDEMKFFADMFGDRQLAFSSGLKIAGDHFDVHRWYDNNLIYGRRGDSHSGEGVAALRVKRKKGSDLTAVVTYKFPYLSARAIPVLQSFAKEHLESL
eukprot:tig00000241_g20916.t1